MNRQSDLPRIMIVSCITRHLRKIFKIYFLEFRIKSLRM